MTRANNTTLKDVWQTPQKVINWLSPIHTDPCAGPNTTIGSQNNYTKEDNGLKQDWHGRVFVNPPFTSKEDWLEKTITESQSSNVQTVFVVTPDSTDTKSWWHKYIAEHADYIWFSEGRISYIDPETGEQMGSPTFGTAISIFGDPGEKTLTQLNNNGQLLKTYTP
jgi:phage N-6-adenine-methyltransferase